jgi:GTP cyclohydrolase II
MIQSQLIEGISERASGFAKRFGRPFVTLCYAQSIDGSLAAVSGKPLALSGIESLKLTHRLRAAHGAIMVGIGTVLSDDPRLTVRHVAGRDPQPVVLDSRLRIPLGCGLMRDPERCVWVAAAEGFAPCRRQAVEDAGGRVFCAPATADGRVDLPAILSRLAENGIASLMVEGGVRVINSLMAARLVDYVVVTIAPVFVGGEPDVRLQTELLTGPRIEGFEHANIGGDLVLWGKPVWAA